MKKTERLQDVARPGIMISQTWPASGQTEGATLDAIEQALKLDYFTAVQTVEIPFPAERKKIAAILEAYPHDYCLARILNKNKLNLSSLDPEHRKRSYEMMIASLDEARECGATAISMVGGARPAEDELREDGLRVLEDSLARICEAAGQSPSLDVHIEPLDYFAHKRGALGTIPEAEVICRSLAGKGLSLYINVDTAHAFLNGEDPVAALESAADLAKEFHFCNCVTDAGHELYGDHHIPFGAPGVLGLPEIGASMQEMLEMGYLNPTDKPVLLCEVLKREQDDSTSLLEMAMHTFMQAWEIARGRTP